MDYNSYLNNNYTAALISSGRSIADMTDKKRENRIIRIRRENAGGSSFITAKVLDEFNYVSHVKLVLNERGDVERVSCDCAEGRSENLCEHSAALMVRLSDSGIPGECKPVNTESVSPDFSDLMGGRSSNVPDFRDKASEPSDNGKASADPGELFTDALKDLDVRDIMLGLNVPLPDEAEESPEPGMKVLIGISSETGKKIYWCPNDTVKLRHINACITGAAGTGKTQFTKSLVVQLYRGQKNNFAGEPVGVLIFDHKGDYNDNPNNIDFVRAVNAKIVKPYNMPYNPLSLNHGRNSPLDTETVITDIFGKLYDLDDKQKAILLGCIKVAYKACGIIHEDSTTWTRAAPTFELVYRVFAGNYSDFDTGRLGGIMKKLHESSVFEPVAANVGSLMELISGVVVFDISGLDADMQNLVTALTMEQFYSQMQALGKCGTDGRYRAVRKLILFDEADNFISGKYPSLSNIIKEGGEFGVGVILITQSLKHFCGTPDDYPENIFTWVVHNTADLSRNNVEYLFKYPPNSPASEAACTAIRGLQTHFSIVRLANDSPVIVRDKPFWELMQDR